MKKIEIYKRAMDGDYYVDRWIVIDNRFVYYNDDSTRIDTPMEDIGWKKGEWGRGYCVGDAAINEDVKFECAITEAELVLMLL